MAMLYLQRWGLRYAAQSAARLGRWPRDVQRQRAVRLRCGRGHWSRLTQPDGEPGFGAQLRPARVPAAPGSALRRRGLDAGATAMPPTRPGCSTSPAMPGGGGRTSSARLADVWEYNMTTAYDPLTDQVLMAGYAADASYNAASGYLDAAGQSPHRDLGHSGALDPARRQFVTIGRGTAYPLAIECQRAISGRALTSTPAAPPRSRPVMHRGSTTTRSATGWWPGARAARSTA